MELLNDLTADALYWPYHEQEVRLVLAAASSSWVVDSAM